MIVTLHPNGFELNLDVDYDYHPGEPQRGMTPADPPSVEIRGIVIAGTCIPLIGFHNKNLYLDLIKEEDSRLCKVDCGRDMLMPQIEDAIMDKILKERLG